MDNASVSEIIYSLKDEQRKSPGGLFHLILPGENYNEAINSWSEGANEAGVKSLIDKRNWYFPQDYREFLLTSNGCTLFAHPSYGGGIDLLDIERMTRIHEEMGNIPDHWYPIAWTNHTSGVICIDSHRCRDNVLPYIYFLDAIEHEDAAIPIYCGFKTWFERLITCQGKEFWLWDYHDKLNGNRD